MNIQSQVMNAIGSVEDIAGSINDLKKTKAASDIAKAANVQREHQEINDDVDNYIDRLRPLRDTDVSTLGNYQLDHFEDADNSLNLSKLAKQEVLRRLNRVYNNYMNSGGNNK